MSCADCRHAVTKSDDGKLMRWLNTRGLAICRPYSKRAKRNILITLINAAGPYCGGRDFSAKKLKEEAHG